MQYFEELCETSKLWAKYFRTEKLIRRSNTNNYVEAQFLVVKNTSSIRQRQYNIDMLFDKLMLEFEDHFKRRLLSVADGTFDVVYSYRFKEPYFKSCSGTCKNLKACFNFVMAFIVFIINEVHVRCGLFFCFYFE